MTDDTAVMIDDEGDSSDPPAPESPIPHKRYSHHKKTSLTFNPKECPWQALRDVVFMKQQLGLKNPDICKVLKTRYEDHQHIKIMISSNVNMMNDWWHDPLRPDSHLPLNHGIKDYAELALGIKKCLHPSKLVPKIAPAPVPDDSLRKILPKPRPNKRTSLGKSDEAMSNMHIEDTYYPTGVSSTSRTPTLGVVTSPAWSASQRQPVSQTGVMPQQLLKRKSLVLSEVNSAGPYATSNTASPYLPTSQYKVSAHNPYGTESDRLGSTSSKFKADSRTPAFTSLSTPAPPWTISTFPKERMTKRDHDAFNEEDNIPFDPQTCPWHALRDAIFSRNEMDLTRDQVCLLLRHRYGAEFPCVSTLTVENVVSMWDFCDKSGRVLYEQNERGMMQIEAELRRNLKAATEAYQAMNGAFRE
ncbi:hypothetical protein N7G274_006571 [Stereocaulon virgatum]|uniref:Clr5 domain-containing protein n=1 Tax=Stereocaulon virgatum TaxID=373712 RepID=A0ABR4A883_9LECA